MVKYVSSLAFVMLVGCVAADDREAEGELVEELVNGPDLTVTLAGPTGAVGGNLADLQLTLRNIGNASAVAGKVTIALPPTASFYSSPLCTWGSTIGTVSCSFGTVTAGTARSTSVRIAMPVAPTATFLATASTTTAEQSTQNNTAQAVVSLAPPPPPVPVAIAAPQNIRTRACNGTVPSFAGCTPGSYVIGNWTLDLGGGIRYSGTPMNGVWSQPSGGSSLEMLFYNGNGALIIRWVASGVSATCFNGLMYQGTNTTPYGALEVCTQ